MEERERMFSEQQSRRIRILGTAVLAQILIVDGYSSGIDMHSLIDDLPKMSATVDDFEPPNKPKYQQFLSKKQRRF